MVYINASGQNRWPREEDPDWEKGYRYDYMRDRAINRRYFGPLLDSAFEAAQAWVRRAGQGELQEWQRPGPYTGIGPSGYRRSDERIAEHVHAVLTRDGRLDARQIRFSVENGVVTLNGSVSDRRAKRMAEDLAASVRGVTDVHNRLEVGGQPAEVSLPEALNSLEALFFDGLRDLYDAERQQAEALLRMAEAAHAADLQRGFREHFDQTRRQIERLEDIFRHHGRQPGGRTCEGMRGILHESQRMLGQRRGDPVVLDAALIVTAQKAEHYEIAGYGSLRAFARQLGWEKEAGWLERTLDEETKTDERLTSMAVGHINRQAQR